MHMPRLERGLTAEGIGHVYSDSKRMFHATYFPAENKYEGGNDLRAGMQNIFRHVGFLTYTAFCA